MIRLNQLLEIWTCNGIPLAWRQLMADRKRFYVAVFGVSFGVILMLFQLGIYQAIMRMVARPITAMKGELVLISRNYQYIMTTESFPERRLYQAAANPSVKAVYPVMLKWSSWRNPENGKQHESALFGIRPSANPFVLPEIATQNALLSLPDGVLYDEMSDPEYGDIASLFNKGGPFSGEINKQRVRVLGTFRMGETLAAYGHIVAGHETFRRIQNRQDTSIELGMIELQPQSKPKETAQAIQAMLPEDVLVLTREEFTSREQAYWNDKTPVGFIVTAGVVIAMLVGTVIVYQILYTDINDHIREYATLKALGLGNDFFLRLILQEATLLPIFGFIPGLSLSAVLFWVADKVGGLPTRLTLSGILLVFALTTSMCVLAGLLATRRLRAADPADIF